MDKIAILTGQRVPELLPYDQHVRELLRQKGVESEILLWEEMPTDFSRFNMVLCRTIWGYHTDIQKFYRFLDQLQAANVPVWNPVEIIRKNAHKFYLRELQQKGFNLIPSLWLEKNTHHELSALLQKQNWQKAIVKPAISADSENTYLCDMQNATQVQPQVERLLQNSEVIVQRFMDEITTQGEFSTIFFSNGYHYTVQKRPKKGDFRIQVRYGGKYTQTRLAPEILNQVEQIARPFLDKTLYTRIDGIVRQNRFFLMEVELIEPDLYLDIVPQAAPQLVDSILQKLQ